MPAVIEEILPVMQPDTIKQMEKTIKENVRMPPFMIVHYREHAHPIKPDSGILVGEGQPRTTGCGH